MAALFQRDLVGDHEWIEITSGQTRMRMGKEEVAGGSVWRGIMALPETLSE